jgi:signal transduction histidine kinase
MTDSDDPASWPKFVSDAVAEVLWVQWSDWLASGEKETILSWTWLTGIKVHGRFIRLDLVVPGMPPGILGCLADVTYEEERLAEAEKRRMEAEESKHQQELLIDLTSHEIRTPVSAILQCSSLVKENLMSLFDSLKLASVMQSGFKPTRELLDDIGEDIEALDSELRRDKADQVYTSVVLFKNV